jgi:hypothetical protein
MVGHDHRKRCDGQSLRCSQNYLHIPLFWKSKLVFAGPSSTTGSCCAFAKNRNDVKRMLDYASGGEGVLYISKLDLLKFLPSKQDALLSDYQATGR